MTISPIDAAESSVRLEYADIIEITAPRNEELHAHTFFIDYIDDTRIRLVDTQTLTAHILSFGDTGEITDESIREISLISRSGEKGYVRNNNISVGSWLDIRFGGDFPKIITGEVSSVEEDCIEFVVHPTLTVIYIDFEFKGVPLTIPIESIEVRVAPQKTAAPKDDEDSDDEDKARVEYTADNEAVLFIPENAKPDRNPRELLHESYILADSIVFGDDEDVISQIVELSEKDKIYSLDAQINSMNDELLATIPENMRTRSVQDNIRRILSRFRELRGEYSTIDATGNVSGFIRNGVLHKPLAHRLAAMDTAVPWIVPVVSHRKKILDVICDDPADAEVVRMEDVLSRTRELQDNYTNNKMTGSVSHYKQLLRDIDELMVPFIPPRFPTLIDVVRDVDTVVGSMDDFQSSVVVKGAATRTRFVVQRYLTAATSMVRKNSDRRVFTREPIYRGDAMDIQSLLVMPTPIVWNSRACLPATSIMEKASLSQQPTMLCRILRKTAQVAQITVDDINTEIAYALPNGKEVCAKPREYVFKSDQGRQNTYPAFLNAIVPSTSALIKVCSKYSPPVYSVSAAVRTLEPYRVYAKDISKEHYSDIRAEIKSAMTRRKTDSKVRLEPIELYRSTNFGSAAEPNNIDSIFKDKSDVAAIFSEEYRRPADADADARTLRYTTSSEVAAYIMVRDSGRTFSRLLQYAYVLATPRIPASEVEERGDDDDMGAIEKIKPSSGCERRFLAKKYVSLADLQRDNNETVFYDKALDDSSYSIIESYKSEKKMYSTPEFAEFLEKALVAKHGCAVSMAGEVAQTLILGKKMVRDGEYALLEIRPRAPESKGTDSPTAAAATAEADEIEGRVRAIRQYYLRKNNHWIKDDSVDATAFIESNTLFCNISAGCIKNQASEIGVCKDVVSMMTRPALMAEAARRVDKSAEDEQRELSEDIILSATQLAKLEKIRAVGLYRANNFAYEIGNLYVAEEGIVSPATDLRNRIMSQTDFAKRQFDIIRFVEYFCREPMLSVPEMAESPYWIYCVATNQPLLPRFIHELAKAYVSKEDYQAALDHICRAQGALSDDGDAVVDRYSGFVIRKIEMSGDEGFDEFGFKISTRSLIQKDASDIVSTELSKSAAIFDSPQTQTIYDVFSTLCHHMDVPPGSLQEFVMRVASSNCDRAIMAQSKYEAKMKAQLEKDPKQKIPISFDTYRTQIVIVCTTAVLLVAVQTAVPAIKTQRSVPGCVRSFKGYPIAGGEEDLSGIRYFSCALNRLKTSLFPWKAIKNMPIQSLENFVMRILTAYVMADADINGISEMIMARRIYDTFLPQEDIPEEHREWTHFMPPMMRFTVAGTMSPVSSEFKEEIASLMKKGSKEQRSHLLAIHSKIISGTYAVIERIHAIVASKDLIFKDAANTFFVNNACCNEIRINTSALEYFIGEDAIIAKLLRETAGLESILSMAATTAPFLFHSENTRISRPPIQMFNFNVNIYEAFIEHCRFDTAAPIPRALRRICPEKPAGYNASNSLTEKIDFFKRTGHAYSESDLHKLMTAIHRENIVSIEPPKEYLAVTMAAELLEEFDAKASVSVEAPLRNHLLKVFGEYHPTKMMRESTDAMDALKNYLNIANTRMRDRIIEFLYKHGKMRPREFRKIEKFIDSVGEWTIDTDQAATHRHYEEGLYTAVAYTKTAVHNMSRVFPMMILHKTVPTGIPKHWELSHIHNADITMFMKKHYERLAPYKGQVALSLLLAAVDENTRDIYMLLKYLPINTPLHKNGDVFFRLFDKPTAHLLLGYCWLSVLYEYVKLSDDIDMLHVDARATRTAARQDRAERGEFAMQAVYSANTPELDEAMVAMEEIRLTSGRVIDLQAQVAALIVSYLDIDRESRASVDLDYKEIIRKTKRTKDADKKRITDMFDPNKIDSETRKAEYLLKEMKLGQWSVGLQKGILNYDKAMYDRERASAEALFLEDDDSTDMLEAVMTGKDIEELDAAEEVGDIGIEAAGGYDIEGLREDYLDDYYGDEGARDDGFGYED